MIGFDPVLFRSTTSKLPPTAGAEVIRYFVAHEIGHTLEGYFGDVVDSKVPGLPTKDAKRRVIEEQADYFSGYLLQKGNLLTPRDVVKITQYELKMGWNNYNPQAVLDLIITNRKSTRLNSSHLKLSRMPSSA